MSGAERRVLVEKLLAWAERLDPGHCVPLQGDKYRGGPVVHEAATLREAARALEGGS